MTGKAIVVILLMLISTAIPFTKSYSQGSVEEILSIKGIEGVGVRVDEIDPEAAADGLNGDKLSSAVSNALKKAGIKVLSAAESASAPGKPVLFVSVNTIKHTGDVYSFTVSLRLEQLVTLVRDQSIKMIAPTWSVLGTGASIPEGLGPDVEKYVGLMVQKFIEDFKQANSK